MNQFATLHIAALADLPRALAQAADVVSSRVLPLQAEAKNAWDYIRIEIWEDSGRVIIFPASSVSQKRIEVSGAQIVCAELAGRIEFLSDSDIGDDAYTEEVKKAVDGVVATTRDSMSRHLAHPFRIFDSFGHQK